MFGNTTKGAPFNVDAPGNFLRENKKGEKTFEPVKTWSYAVKSGDTLSDVWEIDHFEDKKYHLQADAPNGFFREFMGKANEPNLVLEFSYEKARSFTNKFSGGIRTQIHQPFKS